MTLVAARFEPDPADELTWPSGMQDDAPHPDASAPASKASRSLRACLLEQAGELLTWTIHAEFEEMLAQHANREGKRGRAAVVRNGYQPPRRLLTSLGPVTIRMPKLRSRTERPAMFHSILARPYLRRTYAAISQAPLQFLHGLRDGDLHAVIAALMGPQAAALPAPVIRRVMKQWNVEHRHGLVGSLEQLPPHALWLQSEDCEAPGESALVALSIGSACERVLGVSEGVRQNVHAWVGLLFGLRSRGLRAPTRFRIDHGISHVIRRAAMTVYPELAHVA